MTGYTSGDISYSYTYDAEGVRRSKQNDNVQGSKITYISDTLCEYSQTLAELNSSDELCTSYTIGLEIISLTRGGEKYYYISDGHGDVRIITDEDGHIKTKYRYNGYGELIETSGDVENSHMYAGECYDEESGLYYLRARYMNPSTGTFTGMDSYAGNISDPDTLHKYLYANGNPVKYVDPSGNAPTVQEQLTAIGISSELDAQKLIILGGVFNAIVKSTVTFLEGGDAVEVTLAFFQGLSFGGLFIVANIFAASLFGMLLLDIFIAESMIYGYMDIYNAIECAQNGHPEDAWWYLLSAAGNFTLAGCLEYLKVRTLKLSEVEKTVDENIINSDNEKSIYIPKDGKGNPIPLRKQRVNGQDIPLPDPAAEGRPHTVLGGKVSSETGEVYRQSATFMGGSWPTANGYEVPISEVHWTDHGRPAEHTNPHQHVFIFDFVNYYWYRGNPEYY